MGIFDEADVWELVDALILYQLSNVTNNTDMVLSRDDGLIIIRNPNGPKLDIYRKRIYNALKLLGFKITIYIIIIMSCRRHGYPWPSLDTSPYRSSLLAGPLGYIPYPHIAGPPAFARPYEGVHRSRSLMSSSLVLQQCPACLVRLTWIVFVMGGRWLYSWFFVRCCL